MSLDERTFLTDVAGAPTINAGNLTIGQTAVGTITGFGGTFGDRDYYWFRTQPGITYRITAAPATWPTVSNTANPSPFFVLRDAAGNYIDDAAVSGGQLVYQFTANTSNLLFVDVQGAQPGSVGGYALLLSSTGDDDVGGTTPAALPPGVQFDGALEQVGDSDAFSAGLVAGRSYFVAVHSPTISDLSMRVLSPAWTAVAQADAGNGFSTSFIAPATGTFVLDVWSASLLQTGDYAVFHRQRVDPTASLSVGTPGNDTITRVGPGNEVWAWSGNDTITLGAGNDFVSAGAGNDVVSGGAGNDLIGGDGGNDALDGGAGIDIAGFSGPRSAFTIAKTGTQFRVTDTTGAEGADLLLRFERLRFSDKEFDLVDVPRHRPPEYGQSPGFLFDGVYYLLANPGKAPAVSLATAFDDYLATGAAQHLKPNSWFDAAYYAAEWADLAPLAGDDATLFLHYNLYGVWEGRSAGPKFDAFDGNRYLADWPDVAAYVDANLDAFLGSRSNGAIAHYVIYGAAEQRTAFDADGAPIDLGYIV